MSQSDPSDDGNQSEGHGKENFQDRKLGQSSVPERVGVPGEGRKCREPAEESGCKEGENPSWGAFAGEITKEAADEKTAKKIANKNTGWETLDRSVLGKRLYPGGETVARE